MISTRKPDLRRLGLICGTVLLIIAGLVLGPGSRQPAIDPAVEEACYNEIRRRAPFGHDALMTYGYREEGSRLGIAHGSLKAKYAKDKWSQVSWICRIDPTSREIARIELTPTTGGQRLNAAATGFK